MREERIEIDGIPAKLYTAGDADALLLLGHGGGYSKDGERFVRLSRQYSEQTGLAVVCIDAVDHGERAPSVAGSGIPRAWHSTVLPQMVTDWERAAESLSSVGPAVAYVGFSMGAIFGGPTVAAIQSIKAAVFVVGGIPDGGGIDDPALGTTLLDAGSRLRDVEVLMLNKADDEVMSTAGTRALFDVIPGHRKQLKFWDGGHDDWPPAMIHESIAFLREHALR